MEMGPRVRPESSFEEASDTVLVLGIGRWDEEALAEAFRRHAGAVFGVARRILRDEGAAREIAHDAFVRLWYEPDRYDPNGGRCARSCSTMPTAGPSTGSGPNAG